jgi:uncharacterized protein YxjI
MTDNTHPAAWHPDPSKRHELRYWDGAQWTEHASTRGTQIVDEEGKLMANSGQTAATGYIDGEAFGYTTPQEVQAQVAMAQTEGKGMFDAMAMPQVPSTDVPPPSYSSTIFTEDILVVNQKAKMMELTAEYGIYNQTGEQIGSVREVNQTAAKKVARAIFNVDSLMTHTLDIVDMSGNLQLRITKPRAMVKPRVIVENAQGTVLGELVTKIRIGKAQIKLMVGATQVGTIFAENFRAWNFRIEDAQSAEIATITKTWEGFAKAMFTTADNYVIQIKQELHDPLKSLVLASSLAVDLILKQDNTGII